MKNKLIRKMTALAAVFVLTAGLASCGNAGQSQEAEQPSGENTADTELSAELMLYTSEPEELVAEMIESFNETYPDITIEYNRAGTGKITAQLDTELLTGSTDANILWFADIAYMNDLDEKGMIEHYVSPNSASVDPQYLYKDGLGGEVRLIYNIIAYNTNEITEAPTDWKDVLTESYKDRFAIADPNISGGSATALVVQTEYPDKVGWDWYEALAANGMKFETANGELQTKVSNGEYAGVEIVDFMARTAKAEGSPVGVCYPASGSILVPTPISLMNNMDEEQMAAAKAFIDWCYTEEGQKLMVSQQYIPVVSGIEGPEGAPKAEEIKTLPFDLDYYIKNKSDILTKFTELYGGAQQ